MNKPKLMVFKCKGVSVPNDLPMCNNTIITNVDDKRIDTRGGYNYELFGKKMFMPVTRTYRCIRTVNHNTHKQKPTKKLWVFVIIMTWVGKKTHFVERCHMLCSFQKQIQK